MAITPFSDDMSIIGKLSTEPVLDGSLTEQQFKDRFDAGGKAIQTYINDTLLPSVAEKPMVPGLLKGDGMGGISAAEPGKDYQVPLVPGDITYSLLAEDVKSKLVMSAVSVDLPVEGWVDNAQTVAVAGVKVANHIVVTSAPASIILWGESQIRATEQAEGTVKFQCEDVPAAAVTANILIVG